MELVVEWHKFSWEAFATLATGLAAVVGAVVIGAKQVRLLERQSEIEYQNSVRSDLLASNELFSRDQSLRLQLLERRLAVVEEFRILWTEWTQQGHLSAERLEQMRILLQRATFLYRDEFVSEINQALTALNSQHRLFSQHKQYVDQDDHKSREYLEKSFAAEDRAVRIMPNLMQKFIEETRIPVDLK